MMTLEQIAQLAGVSKATVSYVLNGRAEKYRISKATCERIEALAQEHGFVPNQSAAALRRGASRALGLIVPDFENRSYMRLAKRLEALARAAGYQLIISSSDDDADTEDRVVQLLAARGVDALLVSSTRGAADEPYRRLLKRGVPVIALDRALDRDAFINIISDDELGATSLLDSLPLGQVRHLALIGARPELPVSVARDRGFDRGLSRYPDIQVHRCYAPQFGRAVGAAAFASLCDTLGQVPDAVITTAWPLMEGVIDHLLQAGLVEGNLSLFASFGDSRLLDLLPLKINSLPQQYDLIADAAWDAVRHCLEGEYQPATTIIPRQLKVRRPL